MNKTTLNKLLLSRSLYQLAKENIGSASGIRLSIACNALQDAVECCLLALSEHLNAGIGQATTFDKYFELINLKIAPRELPFRLRLISLNKLRVNAKHYGLEPAKSELEPLFTTVWEFFSEVTRSVLGQEFTTLSLVDMLPDGEAKDLLRQAETAFGAEDFALCLMACRQAIYVTFEWQYDAQPFLTGNATNGLVAVVSKVPSYARSRQYLEENVKEPTDYVIYDHNALEMDLMTSGVDSVAYWNVSRLTPEVYRANREAPWVIKNHLHKLDSEGIKDRAAYVLLATTEILLAKDQSRSRTRSPCFRPYYLTLNRDSVTVYSRASKSSAVEQITSPGIRRLNCSYSVDGLDGAGLFWRVEHREDDWYVSGFVHADDVGS